MFLPREWVLLKLEDSLLVIGFFFFFFNAMRPFDVNPLTFDERLIDYFFRKLLFLDILRMEEGMEMSNTQK